MYERLSNFSKLPKISTMPGVGTLDVNCQSNCDGNGYLRSSISAKLPAAAYIEMPFRYNYCYTEALRANGIYILVIVLIANYFSLQQF